MFFFLVDIVLGYIPQAAGCAICVYTVVGERIPSKKFWLTTAIFSLIAILIRTAYNVKILDFGFHTVIIWGIFILVAIGFNKFHAMRSICSILLSGVIITAAELVTAGVFVLIYGNEKFTGMMNNTATIEGMTIKSACGVPANLLFLLIVAVGHIVANVVRKRKALRVAAEEVSQNP